MKRGIGLNKLLVLVLSGLPFVSIAQTKPQPNVLTSGDARFVFGQVSEYTSHQFMLDTKTGRLWQLSKYVPTKADGTPDRENAVDVLNPVPYYEGQGRFGSTPYALPPTK